MLDRERVEHVHRSLAHDEVRPIPWSGHIGKVPALDAGHGGAPGSASLRSPAPHPAGQRPLPLPRTPTSPAAASVVVHAGGSSAAASAAAADGADRTKVRAGPSTAASAAVSAASAASKVGGGKKKVDPKLP